MSKQVQNFIDDARRFQRCSDHDLAISSLQLAQQEDHHKEHEIEIQKLFSLSYRKIGNYNMALLHINNPLAPPCEPSGVRQFPSLPLLSVWLPCQQRVAVAGGNDFIEWVLQENNLRGFQDYLKGQH